MTDAEFLAYFRDRFRAERERLLGQSAPASVQRNAMTGSVHDPLRQEFLSIISHDYQDDLRRASLATDPVSGVLTWLGSAGLGADWVRWVRVSVGVPPVPILLEMPIYDPLDLARTEGMVMQVLSPLLAREAVETVAELVLMEVKRLMPPVDRVAAPQPWNETERHFLARCQKAWDENAKWARREGGLETLTKVRSGRLTREDRTPAFLKALIKNRLRGVRVAQLAKELKMDPRGLRKQWSKIARRLQFAEVTP